MDPLETYPPRLTRFQYWRMLLVIGGTNMMAAMVYSVPSPFYPKEAESKGLTTSEYGLVFGLYQLTQFISAPIFGSYMHRNDPQIVYALGATLQGSTVALFGLLDWVNGHVKFLALSILLRIMEAIGAAMLFTAACTIVTKRAQDSVAATFSVLELAFGVGFSIGPVIGEALYVVGGFGLPFFFIGGLVCVVGFLLPIYFRLEGMDDRMSANSAEAKGPVKKWGFLQLLMQPCVTLQTLALLTVTISITFIYAVLEPHLRQFELEPLTVGAFYFLPGVTLGLLSPPIGFICDRLTAPARMTLLGMALSFVSIVMVGPAPFLHIAEGSTVAFILVLSGLFIMGMCIPMVYISTFLQVLNDAKVHFFVDPNGLASGWYNGCLSFGSFIGPSIAGVLTDIFGFPNATYFILGLTLIAMTSIVVHLVRNVEQRSKKT